MLTLDVLFRKNLLVSGVLWVTLASATSAQTTTALAFNSQSGDYVGQGRQWLLSALDGTITATRESNGVAINFVGASGHPYWTFNFVAPQAVTLVPGTYESAQRHPAQNPTRPGLSVYGDGRGCSAITGRFVVIEANYAGDGSVLSFAADYEQHCDGATAALFGSVRFRFATTPAQISLLSGNNQFASVGAPVPNAPEVLVRDAAGIPVPGVPVTFSVGSGGGSISDPARTTNVSGVARAGTWILGPTQGLSNNTLIANAAGVPVPVTFHASAAAPALPSLLDSGATEIAAGGSKTCALTGVGAVKCWGGVDALTPVDAFGLTGVGLALGYAHQCVLTSGGGVKCWGANDYGQLGDGTNVDRANPVDVLGLTTGIAAVTTGDRHTCVLTSHGGVKCWGLNNDGQVGDGTTVHRSSAADVAGLASGVVALSGGGDHTCALTQAGAVRCWGSNSNGELGNGSSDGSFSSPVSVTGLDTGVVAIAAGGLHTCALTSVSAVKCWGRNVQGQLGDGTMTNRNSPVDVVGLANDVAKLVAGGGHTCALSSGGAISCWGFNFAGQLGDGTTTNRSRPVAVPGWERNMAGVAAGEGHTCARSAGGGVKCVGLNAVGQLGDGTQANRAVPKNVARFAEGVVSVSSGLLHTCGLTAAGGVMCWGDNLDGQLGDGTTADRLSPVPVVGLAAGVKQISLGAYHSCALTGAGGVMCWGYNGVAGLGDGTTTSRATPVAVVGLASGVAQVSAGLYHTCALTTAGGVKCWGNNANGQLGYGTTTSYLTAVGVFGLSSGVASIAAGDFHTCALTIAGGMKCWGSNFNGKLGTGTTTPQHTTPVDVLGLAGGVKAISASAQNTCAVTSVGGLKCWGSNSGGQLGDGTVTQRGTPGDVAGLTSGVASVSTGKFHACAVTTTGGLKCWGYNADGQLGDGSLTQQNTPVNALGLTNRTAGVSSGGYHTCAVTIGQGLECWGYNGYGALGDGTTAKRNTPGAIRYVQAINLTPLGRLGADGASAVVAVASSGLPVALDTWTPRTCSITGNSVVAKGSALCGLRVSQTGDGGHAAASQQLRLLATPATIAVSDLNVLEGSAGTTTVNVSIGLSGPSPVPVNASFASSDLDATSPSDYGAVNGSVSFAPGEVSKTVSFNVVADSSVEPVEHLRITLSALSGALPGRLVGVVKIIDDDSVEPTLISVSNVSGPEGYTGGSTLFFPVRLSRPAIAPVTVNYQTVAGSAATALDFTSTSGQLAFAMGEVEKLVAVPVVGDAISEPNESFTLTLSAPTGAAFSPGGDVATGTILNDDLSTISVTDYSIVEGTTGTPSKLAFTVILSATSNATVTVNYATANGTATAGSDYTNTSGTLSIPPGVASLAVQVPITQDAVIEPNETVLLNLSNATGATIFDSQGVGTIVADDGLLVSIGDKTTGEGNTGFTPVTFTVSLSAPAPGPVTVDYATADGTAGAPLDYTAATGTLSFAAGEQTKTVTVQVVGETGEEAYETFFVDLSNATGGANIGDGRGQGTITNTDGSTDRSRLMFHNFVTNRLYRWHMKNGNTLDTFNWVTPWATDPGWTVGAVADFDQDGQLDYLWHNVNDGRLLFWYIDGDNLKGFQFLPYTLGPPWRVATTFDADGNGTPDIVYYNATLGLVRVMRHDNATLLGQYDLAVLLPGSGPVRIVASVDADNDGDDELALYNSATGQVAAWNLTGPTLTSTFAYANTQSTTQAYNLVSTKTDFNDDGLADFLWHNPTPTGVFSVWFMNGTTRLGVGQFQPFTATDPVWRVVGSANVW
jgi:alpha-tubulin suppressor-like RCC1 family protein